MSETKKPTKFVFWTNRRGKFRFLPIIGDPNPQQIDQVVSLTEPGGTSGPWKIGDAAICEATQIVRRALRDL